MSDFCKVERPAGRMIQFRRRETFHLGGPMSRSSALLAALAVSALLQPTSPSVAAEERSYSDQERIEICRKKGSAPLDPSETQPLEMEKGGKIVRPRILQ